MSQFSATRTALVTGGTGFIGSHLVRRLLAEGWTVHVIGRRETNYEILAEVLPNLILHIHDGSTESMFAAFERAQASVVFHLASLFLPTHTPQQITPLIESNVLFGTQLLEAMACFNCPSFINAGTSWQHYENREYSPVCLYAASKQAFESVLSFYVEARAIKAITLKLFDTYGPRDPRQKLFSVLRHAAQNRTHLDLSPGEQLLNLVYIDDVIDAFLLAAERVRDATISMMQTYAVGAKKLISLRDIVSTYARITSSDIDARWGARPYRDREVLVPWNRGMSFPGWEPQVDIEEGIRRLEGLSIPSPKTN